MNINWFPGHMKKTLEDLESKARVIDFIIEMLDARIPYSSQNPSLQEILPGKKRLVLLNKSDLAEEKATKDWLKDFNQREGTLALIYNSKDPRSKKALYEAARSLNQDILEKRREKQVENKSLRAMVIGIPNVGKSTFINSYIGKKSAKIGNRPGITKSNQWIRLGQDLDLLDTPGVLWPKFENQKVAKHLAYVGSIKDELLDMESLALAFIEEMKETRDQIFEDRYQVDSKLKPLEIYEKIGKKRGAILKGGYIDYEKTAKLILDDFRKGRLGPLSLEVVHESI